jgi:hypothetical protein
MINEKNIADTVSSVTRVAESIIENMPVGSRFTTKEFIDQVVEETHVAVAVAAGVTALVVNNCDCVKPRAGRGGGIFKIVPVAFNMKDDSSNVDVGEDDDMGEEN